MSARAADSLDLEYSLFGLNPRRQTVSAPIHALLRHLLTHIIMLAATVVFYTVFAVTRLTWTIRDVSILDTKIYFQFRNNFSGAVYHAGKKVGGTSKRSLRCCALQPATSWFEGHAVAS
jgi:hypothetical protein